MEFTGFVLVQKTWPYRTLQTIEEFKKGKVEFRADKTGIVHLPFGKANFSEEDLLINLMAAVVWSETSYLLFVIRTLLILKKKHYLLNLAEISGIKQANWGKRSILEKRTYMLIDGAFNPVRYKRHAWFQACIECLNHRRCKLNLDLASWALFLKKESCFLDH